MTLHKISSVLLSIFCCLISFNSLAQDKSADEISISRKKIEFLLKESEANIKIDEYYEARKNLDDALKISKSVKNFKPTGLIYQKIGNLLLLMEEFKEAELSFTKAIIQHEATGSKKLYADSYCGLADSHYDLFNFNSAIKHYKTSIIYYGVDNRLEDQLFATLKKGIVHYKREEFSYALEDFNICIKKAKTPETLDILSAANLYKGHIQAKIINLEDGFRTAYKGLKIAEENNFVEILKNTFIIISDIEERKGNLEKANKYLRKHIRYNDSLNAIKNNKLSVRKRLEFLSDHQTEYQIEKIENLQELQNTKAINKATTMLSIAFITILSLFTISLYKNNSIRKKSNSDLSQKNKELIIAKVKAEEAAIAKAKFLSTVTHELRTPLYAVTGLTNMLIEENPKKNQLSHLKSLKFSGDYLLTFINDILEINKIEAKKSETAPVTINLKTKIENIILALTSSQPENNVTINFNYDKNLPEYLIIDKVKISQILINLIGNALKFTKNGTVWIRVINVKSNMHLYTIRFEVEDNGIGVSKEYQELIFESFSQGSVEINRQYGGTGLGLPIVKGLVEVLGGNIKLESKLGIGTKFYFEIDASKSEKIIKPKPLNHFENINKADLENIKMLVVDDNKINQMITQKTLTKMHIKSDVTDNGLSAIELVKTNKYNAVLMDIHMPGMSGLEATKEIRTFNKDIVIFALTAVKIDDNNEEFIVSGFNDVIPKPFKQEVFDKILFTELFKAGIIG